MFVDIFSDPDHEPLRDVLSRLDSYTQNYTPAMSVAYTDCECEKVEAKMSNKLALVYDSTSDGSDSDDDGGFSEYFKCLFCMI